MTTRSPRHQIRNPRLLALSLAAVIPALNPYLRADATWTASNGTWSTLANWSTNPVPNAKDAAVLFDTAAARRVITLDGTYTVGSITCASPVGDTLVGGNLTLSASAGNATITVNNVGTSNTVANIQSAVFFSSPTVIVNNDTPARFTYTLGFAGNVTSNQPLSFTGPGATVFGVDPSGLTGPLSISGSTVNFEGGFLPTVLGSPSINVDSGGSLGLSQASVAANSSISLNSATIYFNSFGLNTFNKTVTITGDSTFRMNIPATLSIPSLTGAGNLTILGSTCTLPANMDAFTGNISLSHDWLILTGSLVHSQINLPALSTLSLTRPVGTSYTANSVAPGSVVAAGGILGVAANIDFRPALAPNPDLSGIRFDTSNATLAGSNSLDLNVFLNPSAVRLGGNGSIASTMNIRPDLATHTFRFGFPQSLSSVTSLTINSTLADHDNAPANLDLTGPSTLTLAAANTYSGTTSIASNSSLIIAATGAIPVTSPITNNGNLSANANTTCAAITGAGNVSLASNVTLTIAPNSGASKQTALSLTSNSRLNLSNNPFIIEAPDAATKSTDLTQLAGQISTARNGGLWNGPGITSSAVAADPAHLTLVIIDNALSQFPTYANLSVDSSSILLVPARFGDANLDGHVDLSDLNAVLNNFGASTGAWTAGNFDGQSTINLTDLADVLNNFGQTNPSPSLSAFSIPHSAFPLPTPEPTSLALLGLGTFPLLNRRRKV